ncbi:MAG: hypothetical protein JWN07_2306 [Hyphomicrobiales bacterium]|nr:hypothetical protein [Hyphomicrobiales bacterium]
MKPVIVTYWEGKVSWLERLSLATMMSMGHRVELFTRDVAAMRGTLEGVEVFDVRDVLPDEAPAILYHQQKHYALYADIVRIALLRQSRGLWCDADCILLSELPQPTDYVMGWLDNGRRINNAVLHMPSGSELLETYWRAITAIPVRAPWATPRVRVLRELSILCGNKFPRDIEEMSIGPRALTYFVERLGLQAHVAPKERFYPLRDSETHLLIDADDRVARAMIGPATEIVHAWHGKLKRLHALDATPPATSWLGQQCAAYGIR